jgi:hypothetical protein
MACIALSITNPFVPLAAFVPPLLYRRCQGECIDGHWCGHGAAQIVAALLEQVPRLTLTSRAFFNDVLGECASPCLWASCWLRNTLALDSAVAGHNASWCRRPWKLEAGVLQA